MQIHLGWVAEFWRGSFPMASTSSVREAVRSSPDNKWEDDRVGNRRRVWGSLWKRKRLVIWRYRKGIKGVGQSCLFHFLLCPLYPRHGPLFFFWNVQGIHNEWSRSMWISWAWVPLGLWWACQQAPLLSPGLSFAASFVMSLPQLLGLDVWKDCPSNSNRTVAASEAGSWVEAERGCSAKELDMKKYLFTICCSKVHKLWPDLWSNPAHCLICAKTVF